MVKEATEKNEWEKLKFLYLGTKSNKSSRGIAFEFDASFVPLDLLIASDIEDLDELVKHLLLRGAPADGLRDCKRPPLLVAMEVMKFNLAVTLLRNNADLSCIVGNEIFIHKEVQTCNILATEIVLRISNRSWHKHKIHPCSDTLCHLPVRSSDLGG